MNIVKYQLSLVTLGGLILIPPQRHTAQNAFFI